MKLFGKNVQRRLWLLVSYVVLGLILMLIFSGKSRADLETIAISPDEQFVACYETGNGDRILLFRADGVLAFTFDVPVELSAGGVCNLYFQEGTLCVHFYRTSKIAHIAEDGTIIKITEDISTEEQAHFSMFSRKNCQYTYDGEKILVTYDRKYWWEYWLLGATRRLTISIDSKNTVIWESSSASGPVI